MDQEDGGEEDLPPNLMWLSSPVIDPNSYSHVNIVFTPDFSHKLSMICHKSLNGLFKLARVAITMVIR